MTRPAACWLPSSCPCPFICASFAKELLDSVNASERSPTRETRPFAVERTGQSVLPQYIPLSQNGMLIKLDDHTHILQQFQQLKLASLGRMSASIAHEIRNPLGAISHAVQLIEESPGLAANDANLLQIAKRHTLRINRIIEDVLQLSNRQQVRTSVVSVDTLLTDFAQRFASEHSLSAEQLTVRTEPCNAQVDPGHLDQVLWNLCTNAQLHNDSDEHCHRTPLLAIRARRHRHRRRRQWQGHIRHGPREPVRALLLDPSCRHRTGPVHHSRAVRAEQGAHRMPAP